MSDNGQGEVSVQLTADAEKLKSGLSGAVTVTQGAAAQLGDALGAAGRAGTTTGSAIDALSEKLQEHGKHHAQVARNVGRFTRELEGLMGKGNETAKMLGELAGGFAIGGGIGLGLEAIKLLAHAFVGLSDEEKGAKEELSKWFDEMEKRHVAGEQALQGLVDKFYEVRESTKLLREQKGVGDQLDEAKKKAEELRKTFAELDEQSNTPNQYDEYVKAPGLDKAREALETQLKVVEKLQGAFDQLGARASVQGAIEFKGDDATAGKAREQREQQERQLRQRTNAEAERQRDKNLLDTEKYEAEAAAIKEKWALKSASDEERVDAQVRADLAKLRENDTATALSIMAAGETEKARLRAEARAKEKAEVDQYNAWLDAKYAQDLAHAQTRVKGFLSPMKHAMDSVFTGILDGQLNLSQVLEGLWKGIAKTVISALTKIAEEAIAQTVAAALVAKPVYLADATSRVAANEAIAASGAFAAMASVPFIGPALGAAAMAEALAAITATTGPLLAVASAAGGWQVPSSGGPFPAILHADEKVLPASASRGLDRLFATMAGGGGGGAVTVNLTMQAIDGPSVKSLVLSQDFQRAISTAVRRGMWKG